jgi:hypothetical protein
MDLKVPRQRHSAHATNLHGHWLVDAMKTGMHRAEGREEADKGLAATVG